MLVVAVVPFGGVNNLYMIEKPKFQKLGKIRFF
jgi:hypothetical protein